MRTRTDWCLAAVVAALIGGALGVGWPAVASGAAAGQQLRDSPEDQHGRLRPNILLIIADDTGAETSGLYDLAGTSGVVETPNIERLAQQGLVFEHTWASPMCSPTRATILTGLYGHRSGVTIAGDVLPTTTTSLFEYIASESPAEYGMGVFGKWHLGGNAGAIQHVRDTGVPVFKGFLGAQISNYFDWMALDITGAASRVTTYASTAITNFAVDFIRDQRRYDSPWFAYVAYNAAHSPYQVPPLNLHTVDVGGRNPGVTSNTVPVYQAMIQALDSEVGRLLAEIDLEDTVVIYIGDNGTPDNVKDTGTGVRGAKQSVYEGGVRVPMVIAGPGVRTGVERGLTVSTDLFATIAALAGISVARVHDSFSLVPVLRRANASSGRQFSFTEHCGLGARRYAIRNTRHKLLFDNQSGGWALYDLVTDPLETTNRYDDPELATVRATLNAEIESLKSRATAGCFQ